MISKENRFGRPVETFPVQVDGLMLEEQRLYYMGWHNRVGDLRKVIYNAMGPDISSILLVANPAVVIGIDNNIHTFTEHSQDYVEKYWKYVDTKPIIRACASSYVWGMDADTYEPPADKTRKFLQDMSYRQRMGYWDVSTIRRWDIDRLFFVELKKFGIRPETIVFSHDDDKGVSMIMFPWAYPQENAKLRIVFYFEGTVEDVLTQDRRNILWGSDGYFQKALPTQSHTLRYLTHVLPALRPRATVAIGHRFATQGPNSGYIEDIQGVLGGDFSLQSINPLYEKLIDRLPGAEPIWDQISYGMKLNVFQRT